MLRSIVIFQIIVWFIYTFSISIPLKNSVYLRKKRSDRNLPLTYFIDPRVNFSGIHQAINFFKANTCLKWEMVNQIDDETDIAFIPGPNCSTEIGIDRDVVPHNIFVAPSCSFNGNMQREIAHAIGLFNEEVRPDRDNFVTILNQNVIPNQIKKFEKNNLTVVEPNSQRYDYGSLMQSKIFFLSKNVRPTIRLIYPKFIETVGQRISLSFNDIKLINTALCDRCPVTLACMFGGYNFINNCNVCVCPTFFAGNRCQRIKKSSSRCGKTNLDARATPGSFIVRGKRTCYYRIRAGVGFLVKLTINEALLPGGTCFRNKGIEARVFEDKALTGVKYCGYLFNEQLKSKANSVILQYKGAKPYHFMRITYVRVKN